MGEVWIIVHERFCVSDGSRFWQPDDDQRAALLIGVRARSYEFPFVFQLREELPMFWSYLINEGEIVTICVLDGKNVHASHCRGRRFGRVG